MTPDQVKDKRILISPLNWGMGHVARCIPLIAQFLKNQNNVFVACNAAQKEILKNYFSGLTFIEHRDYPFAFGEKGRFEIDLMKQFNKLNKRLEEELNETNQLVKEHSIDLVVSDHRYGFRSTFCKSVILTHQVNLPVRWYEKWVQRIHHKYLRSFDEIWVPDLSDSSLAGALSENTAGFKLNYIGPLSRFSMLDIPKEKTISQVFIISGPIVYGKQFVEELIKNGLQPSDKVILSKEIIDLLNLKDNQFVSSENWKECDQMIIRASKIVSRSGYSTLMDIYFLNIDYDLIPTKGQREQEYLKELWDEKSFDRPGSQITN